MTSRHRPFEPARQIGSLTLRVHGYRVEAVYVFTPARLFHLVRHIEINPPRKRSDSQKEQLRTFLTEKYQQLQEYKKNNPHITKEDITQYIAKNRAAGREKIEKFLTPDQLKIWDAEVAKAKDFLNQRAARAAAA